MPKTSIFSKIKDVSIEDKQFTNRESGEVIEYKRVVLDIEINGQAEKVELVPPQAEGKSAYKVLALADDIE